MLKIILKYNGNEQTILVPEQQTVSDVLRQAAGGSHSCDRVILNGKDLPTEDLDKSFLEHGLPCDEVAVLEAWDGVPWYTDDEEGAAPPRQSIPVPSPKAQVIGCACVIFSAFSPDVLRDFQRYMPSALTLRDESGEAVFAVSLEENTPGSLTKYGAVFSPRTTFRGKATITILLDPSVDDPEQLVRSKLGSSILNLVALEDRMTSLLPELDQMKTSLDSLISAV